MRTNVGDFASRRRLFFEQVIALRAGDSASRWRLGQLKVEVVR